MSSSSRKYARFAGIAYAFIFGLALHANFGVLMGIPGRDDPSAVLLYLQENEAQLRLACAELLIVMVFDVIVAWALFHLFAATQSSLNSLSSVLRLVYTIAFVPVILGLLSALGPMSGAVSSTDLAAPIAADAVSAYYRDFKLTLVFFGLHLMVLAALIASTRVMPTWVGLLTGLAGLGYVVDAFGSLLVPDLWAGPAAMVPLAVVLMALIGEGVLMLWLIVGPIKPAESSAS